MNTVLLDFEKRVSEIDKYFVFIENLEQNNAVLFFPNKRTHKYSSHDTELLKVLKANIFLMLYNLAEASIKQSISEIYDAITLERPKYSDVIDQVKRLWINEKHKNFKNTGTERIFDIISNIADDIIELRFDAEKVISGNIDGRKIREFSEKHGFSNKVHIRANEGRNLHLVKTQRNHLAHGVISFAECGRNYTINDIKVIKKEVIIYLRAILRNISKYIDDKKYRI